MNGINIAHGAAVFALADYAFAAASNSHGITAVALNVSISYIKAVECGAKLTATATEISANAKIANCPGRIWQILFIFHRSLLPG